MHHGDERSTALIALAVSSSSCWDERGARSERRRRGAGRLRRSIAARPASWRPELDSAAPVSTPAGCAAGASGRRRARLRQHERHRRQRDAGVGRAGRSRRRSDTARAIAAGSITPARSSTRARCAAGAASYDGQLGYANTTRIGDNETPGSVGAGRPRRRTNRGRRSPRGGYHTCAILDNGTVRCWGSASSGQLGYGNTQHHRRQRDAGLGRGRWISAPERRGGDHRRRRPHLRAPRQRQGALLGRGGHGQLGYGNTATIGDNETPGSVATGEARRRAQRQSRSRPASRHTCALLDDGKVRCWGLASSGQLGYGNTTTIGDNETPGSVAAASSSAPGARRSRSPQPADTPAPCSTTARCAAGAPARRPARLRQHGPTSATTRAPAPWTR